MWNKRRLEKWEGTPPKVRRVGRAGYPMIAVSLFLQGAHTLCSFDVIREGCCTRLSLGKNTAPGRKSSIRVAGCCRRRSVDESIVSGGMPSFQAHTLRYTLKDGFSLLPSLTAALVGVGISSLPGNGRQASPALPFFHVKGSLGFFALLF